MIRIRKNTVIVFILLLLSMRWDINDYAGNIVTQIIENGLRILAAMYSVFLYIKNRRKDRKISLVFLLLFLMQIWLLISTIFNHGDLRSCFIGYLGPLVIMGLLFESMVYKPDDIIQGSMLLSELLTYTNLFLIVLFPTGMYSTYQSSTVISYTKNWLLGNRNEFIPYFIFFALIAFIYRCHGGKRWREWSIYIACFASVVLVKSGTSIVGFMVLIILFLMIKSEKVKFNIYLLVAVNILFFFIIVIFRLQNLFAFLIEDILGKDLTFTGRTTLWNTILPMLRNNILFGFGVQPLGALQAMVGINYAAHAHNLILNLLYRGGVVYLSLYLVAMCSVYWHLHKNQSQIESQAIAIALFVFQIITIMEPYERAFLIYIIYFMAYYTNRFAYNSV